MSATTQLLPRNLQTDALFGSATLFAFITVQFLDGLLTYLGIQMFGPPVEANPLVYWYVDAFGAAQGLLFMKLLAVACATILHHMSRHRTLAVLTVLYLTVAVMPWAAVLMLV